MLAYGTILTKILATILTFLDIPYLGVNIYPYTVRSFIFVFAFFPENVLLTRLLLDFVDVLWICTIFFLLIGIFNRKARRIAIVLSCIVMLVETISVLFIPETLEMVISLIINFIMFTMTLIALAKANRNIR